MYFIRNKKAFGIKAVSVMIAAALITGTVSFFSDIVSDDSLSVYAAEQSDDKSDEGNIQEDSEFSSLENVSEVEKVKVFFGEAVNVKGLAKGGSGEYTYSYTYRPAVRDTWSKMTDGYVKDTSASFIPKTKGEYIIQVKVKDSRGIAAIKNMSVMVDEVSLLKNNSAVSAKNVSVGENIRITAKHSGGKSEFRYSFYFKRKTSASWKTLGTESGTARTASFIPVSSAVYDIRVDIKDASGQLASKSFTVSASSGVFENISALSKNKFCDLDSPIRLYGLGVGGEGEYSYAYYFKRSSNVRWNAIGDTFGTKTEVRFYPTAYTDYDIRIDVKDETGTIVSRTFKVTSEKRDPLENKSSLNSEVFETGEKIRISGSAAGGTAPYKYTYRFRRSTNTVYKTIGKADTSSVNADITPVSAGNFEIEVTVKDADGKTSVKKLYAAVYDKLVNNSGINNTTIKKGKAVILSGTAEGGTGDYTYSYYYKILGSNTWYVIGTEFTDQVEASMSPSTSTNYCFKVVVKDSNGSIAEKEFTVSVISPGTDELPIVPAI